MTKEQAREVRNQRKQVGLCKDCAAPLGERRTVRCLGCANRLQKYKKAYLGRLKTKVYAAYGGKCACCGENNQKFLTLDHINDDGYKNRDISQTFVQAHRDDYPTTLRILCWNCNCGRAMNKGICPHSQN